MIEAWIVMSPSALKVPIMLEEIGADYTLHAVDVGAGDQHQPGFRKLSPNGKVPAILDHAPSDGGAPLAQFDSGAILIYLAEKSGKLLPTELRARSEVLAWLFWQATGLSPMSGQYAHFFFFVSEAERTYALPRYRNELDRLYGVLNQRLRGRDYLCGDYSIADIGSYPWTLMSERFELSLEAFPDLAAWQKRMRERPSVRAAYDRAKAELPTLSPQREDFRRNMFGMDARAFGVV